MGIKDWQLENLEKTEKTPKVYEALDAAMFLGEQHGISLGDMDRSDLQWIKNVIDKLMALSDEELKQVNELSQDPYEY